MNETYSVRDVAKMLNVAEGTIRKLVKEGEIPSFRPSPRRIVIPANTFEEWMREKVKER